MFGTKEVNVLRGRIRVHPLVCEADENSGNGDN